MILAAALAIVLGGAAWLALRGPREPVYQGKSLSAWLDQYWENAIEPTNVRKSEASKEQAESAVRHIGTNALPQLLQMLAAEDSKLKLRTMDFLDRYSPIKLRLSRALEKHNHAGAGFGLLGSEAKPAIPGLVKLLQGADVSQGEFPHEVFGALISIGDDSIPALRAVLTNARPDFRASAAIALGRLNPGREVVADLIKHLKDEDADVRKCAALAFSFLECESALPALIENLQDTKRGFAGSLLLLLALMDKRRCLPFPRSVVRPKIKKLTCGRRRPKPSRKSSARLLITRVGKSRELRG